MRVVCMLKVRCLEEIESDMVWRKVPMDRLLCGDVGFGKTEVAIRAMFRQAGLSSLVVKSSMVSLRYALALVATRGIGRREPYSAMFVIKVVNAAFPKPLEVEVEVVV